MRQGGPIERRPQTSCNWVADTANPLDAKTTHTAPDTVRHGARSHAGTSTHIHGHGFQVCTHGLHVQLHRRTPRRTAHTPPARRQLPSCILKTHSTSTGPAVSPHLSSSLTLSYMTSTGSPAARPYRMQANHIGQTANGTSPGQGAPSTKPRCTQKDSMAVAHNGLSCTG